MSLKELITSAKKAVFDKIFTNFCNFKIAEQFLPIDFQQEISNFDSFEQERRRLVLRVQGNAESSEPEKCLSTSSDREGGGAASGTEQDTDRTCEEITRNSLNFQW